MANFLGAVFSLAGLSPGVCSSSMLGLPNRLVESFVDAQALEVAVALDTVDIGEALVNGRIQGLQGVVLCSTRASRLARL